MAEAVIIYGKNTWPYTIAAREAFQKEGRRVVYHDVLSDSEQMQEMLVRSKGDRKVPVIVDGGRVTVGYQGKGWRVWPFGGAPKPNYK